jgi:hypothetical protein
MSYITRRPPGPQFICPDPAHSLFVATRHAMDLALIAWLNACPADAEVDLEADATCAIVRQVIGLSRGGTP